MQKAVSLAIVRFNEETRVHEMLLLKHNKLKGLWVMPCGKVEEGETNEQAIIREMKEELDMDLHKLDLEFMFNRKSFYDRVDGKQLFDESIYITRHDDVKNKNIYNVETNKHSDMKWWNINEIINSYPNISLNTYLAACELLKGVILTKWNMYLEDPWYIVYNSYDIAFGRYDVKNKYLDLIRELMEANRFIDYYTDTNCEDSGVLKFKNVNKDEVHIRFTGSIHRDIRNNVNNINYDMHHYNILTGFNHMIESSDTLLNIHTGEELIFNLPTVNISITKLDKPIDGNILVSSVMFTSPVTVEDYEQFDEYHRNIEASVNKAANKYYEKRVLQKLSYDKILFTKCHPDAIIPERAHATDAGMDLFSINDYRLHPGQRCLVKTGIKMVIPTGYEAQVRPKSGLALKQGLTVLNTPGTIDSDYRGEVGVVLINHGEETVNITKGQKIAQMVINRVALMHTEEISNEEYAIFETDRGEGGFGSTGLTLSNK